MVWICQIMKIKYVDIYVEVLFLFMVTSKFLMAIFMFMFSNRSRLMKQNGKKINMIKTTQIN